MTTEKTHVTVFGHRIVEPGAPTQWMYDAPTWRMFVPATTLSSSSPADRKVRVPAKLVKVRLPTARLKRKPNGRRRPAPRPRRPPSPSPSPPEMVIDIPDTDPPPVSEGLDAALLSLVAEEDSESLMMVVKTPDEELPPAPAPAPTIVEAALSPAPPAPAPAMPMEAAPAPAPAPDPLRTIIEGMAAQQQMLIAMFREMVSARRPAPPPPLAPIHLDSFDIFGSDAAAVVDDDDDMLM